MTFPRAIIIALMASMLVKANGDTGGNFAAIAIGGLMWAFTTDPLPAAIERGLEEFRRKYRR